MFARRTDRIVLDSGDGHPAVGIIMSRTMHGCHLSDAFSILGLYCPHISSSTQLQLQRQQWTPTRQP
jgi:hypothetical protein